MRVAAGPGVAAAGRAAARSSAAPGIGREAVGAAGRVAGVLHALAVVRRLVLAGQPNRTSGRRRVAVSPQADDVRRCDGAATGGRRGGSHRLERQGLCGLLAGRRGCGGGVVDAARLRQDAHAVRGTHCTRVAAAAGGPTAVLIGLATIRLRGVCRVFHTLTVVRVAVLANRSGDALGRSPLAVSVQANVWLYHRWISRRGRRRRETGRGGVSWTIRWRRNGG